MKKRFMNVCFVLLTVLSMNCSTKVVEASSNLVNTQMSADENSSWAEYDINNNSSLGIEGEVTDIEDETPQVEENVDGKEQIDGEEQVTHEEEKNEGEGQATPEIKDESEVDGDNSDDIDLNKLQEYKDLIHKKYNYYCGLMNRSKTKRETIARYQKNINNLEKEGKFFIQVLMVVLVVKRKHL